MELPPRYEQKEVEEKIYKLWEKSGYFNPDKLPATRDKGQGTRNLFSIVLPPPNVTGTLHIGHAFEDTFQDIAARFERMRGKRTLWLPGTDHAAIATQSKVEKEIMKVEGKNRFDLGREEFLRRVNDFAQASHETIIRQIKRLGASLDWSREAYTLDEKRSIAVRAAFKKMRELGLVYRGSRVVNWDPKGQTVISDDEVAREERKAKLYTFRYAKDFPIPIATTRPETKVGDTAVAVHPNDTRYKKFIGKEYDLDFVGVPLYIKIIGDPEVDKDFGTGAVGVTPAHSMTDWEMSQRHGLPLIQVIDEHARMIVAGSLKGMKTTEAREWLVAELRRNGLLEKEEEILQNIAVSERTGGIIEPLPKLQWFVAVNKKFRLADSKIKGIKSGAEITLKELMRRTVESGQIKILPERFRKIYFHWIENLRDWCVSRQIWFGHRIPVWYCMGCGEAEIEPEIKSRWFLIRHGESKFNKEKRSQGQMKGNPLTEDGIKQAQNAAASLKDENVGMIISSDLERCKMTAEIIAKATGAKIIFDKRLREKHIGQSEDMTREEHEEKYGRFLLKYSEAIPGGESWQEVEKRVMEAFAEHKNAHDRKNVIIVSHAASIQFISGKSKGHSFEQIFETMEPKIKNTEIIELAISEPCKNCGGDIYEQDPDTFDTWFSSGMWTFSTLGWPEKTKDLATYHPTSLMAPGYEILFLWVARMILMSGCLLGDIPFRTVVLHGIVRDAQGRKFSKSLGNGIDPLVLADKYGADAVRMSLIVGAAIGNDVKFDENRVRGYRNFSTKIWNAARFILMNRPLNYTKKIPGHEITRSAAAYKKTLAELAKIKTQVTRYLEKFEYHLAAETIYHYFWHTFADKIIEEAKPRLLSNDEKERAAAYQNVETILLACLKMLHPFMPFVTEEIYRKFKSDELLMIARW